MTEIETALYWQVMSDMRAARAIGDDVEVEYLTAELDGMRLSTENASLRLIISSSIDADILAAAVKRIDAACIASGEIPI